MNDNPYASPREYGERPRLDWDLAFRAWFVVALRSGQVACFVLAVAWIARGHGFYSPRLVDAITYPLGAICLSGAIPVAVITWGSRRNA